MIISFYLYHLVCILLFFFLPYTRSILVFQPARLIATGPTATAFLIGNTSNISLSLRTVSVSKTTGNIDPPSCVTEETRWLLTTEQQGKNAVQVQLRLNRSLQLCVGNETDTDCCPKPLCVLEALQVSACVDNTPQASLLIQAKIYALLLPTNTGPDNKTNIPNQVYQPLGSCPCDLTRKQCDVRCCCDKDCSPEDVQLFASHCLPGPFGGDVSPTADYHCSVQSSENSPDWFPFLCVVSSPENNPRLGLFYDGNTVPAQPGPSFQSPVLSAPAPVNVYSQGSPILTINDQYFTIPQAAVLGQCLDSAPVAFLQNFNVKCVTLLRSCPSGYPLLTTSNDLLTQVKNGQGGVVAVDEINDVTADSSQFISNIVTSSGKMLKCEDITLALDYKFYWNGNGITNIKLTRTVGTITLSDDGGGVFLTARYSAEFLNGELMVEPNSGNPGYQVGKPVIAGNADVSENDPGSIQRTSINLWKPVGEGLCSSTERKPILYGENSTAGCLLPVNWQNMSDCDNLRETVTSLQASLIAATYVAKSGNPDAQIMADWVNISFVRLNSSGPLENTTGSCYGIPSHQHIHVLSFVTGMIQGVPQKEIRALQISYSPSTWRLDCGGGDFSPCVKQMETQRFPVTSSVTFTDIPINTGPPKTRFQINFTEYDCNRNDVCWPELAFPITRYYTGEPYSLALAKGLILVFFFFAASVLGTPWKQIRQAWASASL